MFNKYRFNSNMGIEIRRDFNPSSKKRKAQKCDCGIMTFDKGGECAVCKVKARFTASILKGVPMSRFSYLRLLARV